MPLLALLFACAALVALARRVRRWGQIVTPQRRTDVRPVRRAPLPSATSTLTSTFVPGSYANAGMTDSP